MKRIEKSEKKNELKDRWSFCARWHRVFIQKNFHWWRWHILNWL